MLAGCASAPPEPTLADAMRGHSENAQAQAELKTALAKQWERGNELERDGERRVARARETIEGAEERIDEARDSLERGNDEIETGRALKTESERRFRAAFPKLSLNPQAGD